MKQQQAWTKEYRQANLASTKREQPSRALTWFLETVKPNLEGKRVIEFGCGNGRNLVYLAKQGAYCTGVDFVDSALATAQAKVTEQGLEDKITILQADLGKPLPFTDASFDIGLDLLVGSSLFEEAWETYKKEVVRVLAPGGYFVCYYFDSESSGHWRARNENPGPYPNSIINPSSGIVERAFSRANILKEFSTLRLVATDAIEFTDQNYQQTEKNTLLLTALQK